MFFYGSLLPEFHGNPATAFARSKKTRKNKNIRYEKFTARKKSGCISKRFRKMHPELFCVLDNVRSIILKNKLKKIIRLRHNT